MKTVLILVGGLALAAPASDVESVADALIDGSHAEAERRPAKLATVVERLNMLGARQVEGDSAGRWQAAAGRHAVPPLRGRALGPAYREGTLGPGATLATMQLFFAGKRAEIAVVPQPGARLSVRIGPSDRAICAREVGPARGVCSWTPLFTERVEIRISNPARQPARYWLVSN